MGYHEDHLEYDRELSSILKERRDVKSNLSIAYDFRSETRQLDLTMSIRAISQQLKGKKLYWDEITENRIAAFNEAVASRNGF